MRRTLITGTAAASILVASAAGVPAATGADWSAYLHGPRHASYNPAATAVTTANAAGLRTAWTWSVPGPTRSGQPAKGLLARPTVSEGRIYIGATTGVFYALSEQTGRVVWSRDLRFSPRRTCNAAGISATATVANDPRSGKPTVYVGDGSGDLDALDAGTGAVKWHSVIARQSANSSDYYDWSSPTVVGNRVFIGESSHCDKPLIRGFVRSYDRTTGRPLQTYYVVPAGAVGGSVWTSVASDGKSVWVTTGNADETGSAPGDSNSIVRLSAATLARQDIWTVPGIQHVDLDFGASPTLFQATLGGTKTEMVGACDKNGVFYAWRSGNLSAGPVWSRQIGATGGDGDHCQAGAVWDTTRLIVASNATTISGKHYRASLRQLDPATGAVVWQRGLPAGPIFGTPSEDGSGVLAATTWNVSGSNALYLVNARTGGLIKAKTLPSVSFAQPVFADNYLFVATANGVLTAMHP